MVAKRWTDEQFKELWDAYGGAAAMSAGTGVDVRTIYKQRRAIENKEGVKLIAGKHLRQEMLQEIKANRKARIRKEIDTGTILIFSDAHYWPQHISTAHAALVEVANKLKPDLIIANGDIFDGASQSRHTRINWEEVPGTAPEIWACQSRLAEIEQAAPKADRIWTLGNHCVDTETELLTKRGWVRYTDIHADDQVLSYVDNSKAEWTEIDEVMVKPFNGKLITVEGPRISMAMTPGHRVLGYQMNWRTRRFDRLAFHKATELPYSLDVPVTGQVNSSGVDLSEGQIRLSAWLLTDGCADNYSYSIYQSKPEGREKVERVLAQAQVDEYSIYERDRDIQEVCGRALLKKPLLQAQYYIGANETQKIKEYLPNTTDFPEWAVDLSGEQFQWFLESLVDGDGVWDGAEDGRCAVMYGKEQFLSSLQAVATQHGWRARLVKDNRGDYRLWLSKRPNIRIEKKHYGSVQYNGDVWCLRVPHENFMVRRNGCAYFTGNCARFESYIANNAPELAKVQGVHLKDHFPSWEPCWSVVINEDSKFPIQIKHRWKGGIGAARNNALNARRTFVTGHTHQMNAMPLSAYEHDTIFGIECGTLAEPFGPQFEAYTEDNPRNWISGFCVLTIINGHLLWPEFCRTVGKGKYEFRGAIHEIGSDKKRRKR